MPKPRDLAACPKSIIPSPRLVSERVLVESADAGKHCRKDENGESSEDDLLSYYLPWQLHEDPGVGSQQLTLWILWDCGTLGLWDRVATSPARRSETTFIGLKTHLPPVHQSTKIECRAVDQQTSASFFCFPPPLS